MNSIIKIKVLLLQSYVTVTDLADLLRPFDFGYPV